MNCTLEFETEMALNRLGEAIRQLMGARNLSQVDLATQINLSATALSLIVNGQNRPRQKTFTRLLNRLSKTPEERKFLLDAYLGIDGDENSVGEDRGESYQLPSAPQSAAPFDVEEDDELDAKATSPNPSENYLAGKAASIAFQEDVEHLLQSARIPFIHPYHSEKIACDFVTKTKTKIVIECKSNLNRDWDRLLGQCMLLRDNLPAKEVVVVIPYHNKISALYAPDFKRQGIHVETPSTLTARLKQLGV